MPKRRRREEMPKRRRRENKKRKRLDWSQLVSMF
jgi:hypothetical protein